MESASLAEVRSIIATALLQAEPIGAQLGDVMLRPHQTRAASRLASIMASRGGAMLADRVGVGKTYTALAVAAHVGGRVLVVAPSSLKPMWLDAARHCGLTIDIVSHESLSRGRRPATDPTFVIVDEAHRLRTSTTRRYSLLADVCRNTRVLLVTATPVHNSRADLSAQLALFLGRVAWELSEEDLAKYVVRDTSSVPDARPMLAGPHRISLSVEDDCLDELVALPAPVPAKDESIAAALLTYGLLHQWTSSRAALVASLGRRRARGFALMAAIESGRRPTRAELAAWAHAGDSLQLAFPEIMATDIIDEDIDAKTLLVAIEQHGSAIDALLARMRTTADPDVERAEVLRRIRRAHPGERIIAFCQYAETVNVLRSQLARDPGIAALTATGARVASGRIPRAAVLAQFIPQPDGASLPARAVEHIGLLITTDLLSEGLNLQEASVIVHLDLPWNPARLDQRVGRALRLGSRHATVTVYAIAPPASAERLLRIESRLRDKLSVAARTIGVAGGILPTSIDAMSSGKGLAEQRGAFESVLRGWIGDTSDRKRETCVVAAVRGGLSGFLALIRTLQGAILVADVGSGIETSTPVIARAIAACQGMETPVDASRAADAANDLRRWLAARRGSAAVNLSAASVRSRRAALTRVARALASIPRHQRSTFAPLAHAARAVASSPLPEGAERILETLVGADLPDAAWLQSIAAYGELNARPRPPDDDRAVPAALILLG